MAKDLLEGTTELSRKGSFTVHIIVVQEMMHLESAFLSSVTSLVIVNQPDFMSEKHTTCSKYFQ